MFTHLAWIWWAADPVQLMREPRKEMESLRRWRLPDSTWNNISPKIYMWVLHQLHIHCNSTDMSDTNLKHVYDKLGKEIHTHILYEIILPIIRPTHVYRPYIPFKDTLRRS